MKINVSLPFCVYIAAQAYLRHGQDSAAEESFKYLRSVLVNIKVKNPSAESFVLRLDAELQGSSPFTTEQNLPRFFRLQNESDHGHKMPWAKVPQTVGEENVLHFSGSEGSQPIAMLDPLDPLLYGLVNDLEIETETANLVIGEHDGISRIETYDTFYDLDMGGT